MNPDLMYLRGLGFRLSAGAALVLTASALSGCGANSPPAAQQIAQPATQPATAASPSDKSPAAQMVAEGRVEAEKILGYTQTEAIRNMLGSARGVFIVPDYGGASFILGVDSGTGFLMRRHGQDWSDPVFFSLTQTSAGTQLGVKNAQVVMLLMTDTAVEKFVKGRIDLGGTGGITVGGFGLSIVGAGGIEGGLEALIISTSQGVSLGGGVATLNTSPDMKLNTQAYGASPKVKDILASSGGRYSPARQFQMDLKHMVVRAWNVPGAAGSVAAINQQK